MKLAEMELKIVQTNDDGLFGDCYKNDFEYAYNRLNDKDWYITA